LLTHSNVRVRNVATIGGNLAHGDPHMDLPPVLIALGVSIRVVGPGGERDIPVEELCTGYMTTVLGNDELIALLRVPPQTRRRAAYAKVTARSADDWPALGIAVSVGASGTRIAVGAATEIALRLPQTEALLAGKSLDDKLLREAGKCAAAEAPVVGDLHGSAAYKRVLLDVHLRRALQRALAA
jgi:aerobic carbon-monoxide dehydrogenase medium subunit